MHAAEHQRRSETATARRRDIRHSRPPVAANYFLGNAAGRGGSLLGLSRVALLGAGGTVFAAGRGTGGIDPWVYPVYAVAELWPGNSQLRSGPFGGGNRIRQSRSVKDSADPC
jgi:hypothetical protein